jgi:ABC-type multidrug transport system permease subunit
MSFFRLTPLFQKKNIRVNGVWTAWIWVVIFFVFAAFELNFLSFADRENKLRITTALIGLVLNLGIVFLPNDFLSKPRIKIFSTGIHNRITVGVVFLMNLFLLFYTASNGCPNQC